MAKKISIKNIPIGYQSFITNGKHAIVGDEPTTSKGTDLGFSPEDLILSSLAMCKVATVRFIARKTIGTCETWTANWKCPSRAAKAANFLPT